MATTTILDVIENGKWTQALFTTFALSLSFFESILLRALRHLGCQEIWIISDLQGYKASLIERRSTAVGQDYRLLPVRLRKGVFHPKCIYLAGPDEDALLVGSGNLTFGGFGRNLEVLDTFSSKRTPDLFTEFADFLSALRSRSDFECPDMTWCTKFEVRARTAGGRRTESPTIRLIHSVRTPVIDQLAEAVPTADELTVMSPFYDEDGYAVRSAAERLRCKNIRVAVPPKTAAFNFPFHDAKHWPQRLQPVWVEKQDGKRPLHAKWFEFRSKAGKSVMTGSVNATRQALCTTNNIEVSILRLGAPSEQWADWAASQFPASFVATMYTATGEGELSAHATLSGAVLDGAILGLTATTGRWQCALTKPNGDTKRLTVELNQHGRFHTVDAGLSEFSLASGLQITLTLGGVTARGWVHVEDVLRMTRLPKLNVGAMLRIIARENTEDDDIALLEYLAINAHKHLPTFVRKINAGSESSHRKTESAVVTVDLEELAPTPSPSSFEPGAIDLAELSLERVFAQLRRRLLGHGGQAHVRLERPTTAEIEIDEPDAGEDNENGNGSTQWDQPPERMQTALAQFDHEMRSLVAAAELQDAERRGMLVLWFEVAMNMLLVRKADHTAATSFLSEWINTAGRLLEATPEIDSAEQHLVTSTAVLASQCPHALEDLHELLECFYAGAVDEERLAAALLPAAGVPFGILSDDDAFTLQQALHAVLQSSTLRQEVVAVVEATRRGQPINDASPIFKGEAGQTILAQLHSLSGRDRFKEQIADKLVCANCYTTLPAVMAAHLTGRRIAWHCGWFTVRTKK